MKAIWEQHYYIWGQGLAVSTVVAAAPTAALLYLLAARRKPAWAAGLAGLGASLAVAVAGYGMPVKLSLSAAAYGGAFGLFPISWIVFWAIVLYNVTVVTGRFAALKESLGSMTLDLRLQAILIAFGLGAFLEGASGFGTPIAVAGAMMAGLGFSPFYAAALCLLANTAPVAFGAIGVPIVTLAGVTGLPLDKLSGAVGLLCAPIALILPGYLIATMGGVASAVEVWPALAVAGLSFASVQYLVSNFVSVQLTAILSAISALGALIALLRVWRPQTKALQASRSARARPGPFDRINSPPAPDATVYRRREALAGWMPYGLLVILVLLWGLKRVQSILDVATFRLPWPGLHNLILRMPPVLPAASPYPAVFTLNLLSAGGSSCMIAGILAALLLKMPLRDFAGVLRATARQLALPILTIAAVLAMAFVMNYSGATGTLGLACSRTGAAFPFFSPFLGWFGVLLTGSDTSSNALFGALQSITAGRLGVSRILIAAANSSGGVMGKMVSIQSIAVAAAATGLTVRQQSELLRFTLKHSLILVLLVGLEVVAIAYWFRIV